MKKLLRSFAIVASLIGGLSASSFAQYDVACDAILFPVNGASYQSGLDLPLQYVRSNAGMNNVPATDTVFMSIFLDGNFIAAVSRTPSVFAVGDSDTAGITFPFSALPPGTYTICVAAGFSATSGVTDINAANDTSCATITLVAPDMALTNFVAIAPALANGDTLAPGDTITTMQVTVENTGTIPIIAAGFPMQVYIGTDTVPLNGPLNAALLPDSSVTLNLPGFLLPTEPTAPGPFDICARVNLLDDTDPTNDEICNTYVRGGNMTNTMDLSFSSISITNPAIAAGDTYLVGSAVSEIELVVRNTGNTAWSGAITADLTAGGATSSISDTPPTAIAAGGTYTITVSTTDLPAFPTAAGNFQLCAALTVADDDASNDNGCESYIAADPANVADVNGMFIRAYYAQGNLIIESQNARDEEMNLAVYSITGREVLNTVVRPNNNRIAIPFEAANSGIYILRLNETSVRFVK